MPSLRIITLAAALMAASALVACNTTPAMQMGTAPASAVAAQKQRAAMEAQMKAMHEMHTRMMNAGTEAERQALMADPMKAMQGGMSLMKGMSAMGAKHDGKSMPPQMAEHHKMMMQHMEMMKMRMDMMAQRMPA